MLHRTLTSAHSEFLVSFSSRGHFYHVGSKSYALCFGARSSYKILSKFFTTPTLGSVVEKQLLCAPSPGKNI